MRTFQTPFFVSPHTDESEGVDYLGLRAINLAMMSEVLPGINNVVSAVRLFSVIAWIVWRHENAVAEKGLSTSAQLFKRYKEKVETLFVWSHVQAGVADGLAGNQQKDNDAQVIRFDFRTFERTGSLLDAAQYGPSLKSPDGLGFLYMTEGFFKVTAAGKELAESLDRCLRQQLTTQQYHFLCSLDDLEAPRDELVGFLQGWHVDKPTTDEKFVFASQLYRAADLGQAHPHARRTNMLYLVKAVLQESGETMTVEEVRRWLAVKPLPKTAISHEAVLRFHETRRMWQLLQVRQAQRLALEACLGWLERCLIHSDATSVEDVVVLTLQALAPQTPEPFPADRYVHDQIRFYACSDANVDGLFAAGFDDPERLDIFQAMSRLARALNSKQPVPELARQSVSLLIQCACYAQAFKRDAISASKVSAGAPFRLPLGYWGTVVLRHETLALHDFLRKIFETYIVSQHWGIAAARSSDERSRVRLTNEDRGLTSLLSNAASVLSPAPTPDRLGTSLALLASCGLIETDVPLRKNNAEPRYWA